MPPTVSQSRSLTASNKYVVVDKVFACSVGYRCKLAYMPAYSPSKHAHHNSSGDETKTSDCAHNILVASVLPAGVHHTRDLPHIWWITIGVFNNYSTSARWT